MGDEIVEFKSLNLRELMKENDEAEIREDPAEDDSANRRQTMGSILARGGGKMLRDAIRSDRSKAWESPGKCRKIAGSRLLKYVLCVKKKLEEEEEDEESANMPRAGRSPSVVDSARLHVAGADGAAAVRVFLVGQSPPGAMDGAVDNKGIPWRFLKRNLRLRNVACCGSSWSAATEQANLNSAVPVALPPTEESDEAISSNNSGALQQHNGNINGCSTSETEGNANQSRAGSRVDAESPPNLEEANSAASDLPAGGGRRSISSPVERNLEGAEGSIMPTGMNLGAALAAERQLRATQDRGSAVSVASADDQAVSGGSPVRVSLMSLLEEADGSGRGANRRSKPTDVWEEAEAQPAEGVDPLCCVCMVRRKGAAFIPCGHTFCRFCSREVWFTRGSCPLCNRCIMEILDIF